MLERLRLLGIVLVLALVALASPQLAGIFFLNLANTQIARAVLRPTNAPDRAALLADAETNLARAQALSNLPRLPLAQVRVALAQNDWSRVFSAFDSADASLRSDFIAQFIWGDAAWSADQQEYAFGHWRSAGARGYFVQEMNRAQYAHRWKDAEEAARIAIGIDPRVADAHYVLANALSQIGSVPEAISELEYARRLTQDNELLSTILSRKGEILATQGQFQEALDAFSQAREIAPLDARPRTDYAIVMLRVNPTALSQSIALLTQVVTDSPWYSAAYIALAELSAADAEAWLKRGLEKNPKDAALLFALGRWYASQHRFAEAKAMLVVAMQNETRSDLLQQIEMAIAQLPSQ